MFLIFFLLIFTLYLKPANAQIPLLYQIITTYRPTGFISSLPQINVPAPTLSAKASTAAGQILGSSTTNPLLPTPVPFDRIGGEGKIITIVVLGDSMIDTLGKDIPDLQSALPKYYPNTKFNIKNYGVGASTLEYALFRLTHDYRYQNEEYPSIISLNPDILIIESFAYNNYGNIETGIDKQWQEIGRLTGTVKEKLPHTKIILATTIAPNSTTFSRGIANIHFTAMEKQEKTSTIKLYLQNLVNFATSQHFPLADAYHPSLVDGDGNKNFISTTDNLHPSPYGARFFCNLLAKTIFNHKLIN